MSKMKYLQQLLETENYFNAKMLVRDLVEKENERIKIYRQRYTAENRRLMQLFSDTTHKTIQEIIDTFLLEKDDLQREWYCKKIGEALYFAQKGYFTTQKIAGTIRAYYNDQTYQKITLDKNK